MLKNPADPEAGVVPWAPRGADAFPHPLWEIGWGNQSLVEAEKLWSWLEKTLCLQPPVWRPRHSQTTRGKDSLLELSELRPPVIEAGRNHCEDSLLRIWRLVNYSHALPSGQSHNWCGHKGHPGSLVEVRPSCIFSKLLKAATP